MSFPISPTNGQIAVVNNVAYEYASANTSWTRVLSIANIIQANVISANVLNVVQAFSITGNIATGNYFIGNGAFLTGLPASYSNANVANYLPTYTGNLVSLTGPVTTTGNITANNVLFGTGVVSGTGTVYAATVSTTGNVNSGYISTGQASVGNLISGGYVSATGNITGGNLSGTNIVGTLTTASQTNITSVGTLGSLTVTANTTSGNLLTGGLITATGNITGGNLVTGAQVVASGVIQTGTGFSTGGYLSVDGDTDLHKTTVTGNLSATGNVTGNYILGNGALLTGVITSVSNINNGTSNVTVVSSGGDITVGVGGTGNVAVFSTNAVTVKGNVLPSANITYDLGTSTQRWRDLWLSNSTIYLGNAQISANATAVTITNPEGGTTVLQGSTPSITGSVVSASGNVTGGNLLTAGLISAAGNITGNVFIGNGSQLTGIVSSYGNANVVANLAALGSNPVSTTGNITSGNLLTSGLISATGNITGGNLLGTSIVGTLTTASQTNITAVGTLGALTVTANTTSGNLLTGGLISATGNVNAGNVNVGNITIATDLISSLGATLTIDPATVGNAGLVVINGNLQVNGTTTTINSNVVSTNDLTVNYANNAINASAANGGGIEVGPIGSPYITWLYNSTANVWTSSDGISAVGNITGGNILGGANVNATTHTGTTVSVTANITGGNLLTAGSISATGNITGGNLSVQSVNAASHTGTIVFVSGNVTGGNILTIGLISATGNITAGNVLGGTNVNAFTHTGTTVSVTANVTGGNLLTGGLISATGNITGGNLVLSGGIVDNTGNLDLQTSAANANINLTPNGSGNVYSNANVFVTGLISASGNITGGNLITGAGTGGNLTGANVISANTVTATANITGGNILTAGLISATGNITVGNITTAGQFVSTLTGATGNGLAQIYLNGATLNRIDYNQNGTGAPTFTTRSSGTKIVLYPNLTASAADYAIGIEAGGLWTAVPTTSNQFKWYAGNTQVAALGGTGNWSVTGTVTGASVVGGVMTGSSLSVTGNIQGGNLRTAGLISATGAITGAAITGSSLTVSTGNITGGNLILSGAIVDSTQLDIQTSAANANIVLTPNGTGNVNTGANLSVTGNVQGGNLRTAGLISATGNITGGNLQTAGVLLVNTGNTAQAITNGAANGVGNIGSSTTYFNTVFAKATSAQYADLAEMYVADADYLPGTVLEFGGNYEVTVSNTAASALVAGVVSTNPAHLMNSTAQGKHLAAIALVGRVPTQVIGPISKGAMMVSAGNGYAQASATPAMGTVIGKAVEDFAGKSGIIEIAVGRL